MRGHPGFDGRRRLLERGILSWQRKDRQEQVSPVLLATQMQRPWGEGEMGQAWGGGGGGRWRGGGGGTLEGVNEVVGFSGIRWDGG